jgi:hypothetical protein
MDTIQAIMSTLASVLSGTWRATGRTLVDEHGNAVLRNGKPRKEYAICAPESAQAGDSIVVHKQRSGELAVFVLTHRVGWRTENGVRQGLWTGFARLNPYTGQVLEESTNAVVELDGE